MEDYIIKTDCLYKFFGPYCAVNNVSITIKRGEIFGLVGKNGAGKTTLIRLLAKSALPTKGTLEINVREKSAVSGIIETPSLFYNLTAEDNLAIHAKLLNVPFSKEFCQKTLELVGLQDVGRKKVKNYSMGMKQRLAIAQALLGEPELLLLDEPTNGLDPQGIKDIREIIERLNSMGVTILISSHILSELSKVATTFAFMDRGRIIKELTADELESMGGGKKIRVAVDNVEHAKEVCVANSLTVTQQSTVALEISTELTPTDLVLLFAKENVKVLNIATVGESLEDFYLGLVGGAK